jgi:hypothetical protein
VTRAPRLAALLDEHATAARDFAGRAAAVPDVEWGRPRAPGKWSPAQEVEHIALAYEIFAADLRGERTMRVIVPPGRRLLLRALVLPYILRRGRFPVAARAPREARPSPSETAVGGKAELLERLDAAVRSLEAALGPAERADASRRVTHAYFGSLDLPKALRLSAVHTHHHARRLPALPR